MYVSTQFKSFECVLHCYVEHCYVENGSIVNFLIKSNYIRKVPNLFLMAFVCLAYFEN